MTPWARSARPPSSARALWGAASQALNSASNFLLTLAAARLMGPEGVGVVTIAFTSYLFVLGFHRALVSEPFIAATAPSSGEARARGAAHAGVLTLIAGLIVAALVALVSVLLLRRPWGAAGLALSAWLPLLLLQDLWRSTLFRDRRGSSAALLDLLWLAVMGACISLLRQPSAAALVASWGLGGGVGGFVGWWLVRVGRPRLGRAIGWWRRELLPFGRWLALEGIVFHAGAWGTTVLLMGFLGAEALGAIRAVQSLFAPMSLLGPAIALPGLPEVARRLSADASAARRYASGLSVAAVALTAVYVTVGASFSRILSLVFGASFARYEYLIWPVGVGQLAASAALGAVLLLKAARAGTALLTLRAWQAATALLVVTVAGPHGLRVLAWWQAAAAWFVAVAYVGAALKVSPEPRVPLLVAPERGDAR